VMTQHARRSLVDVPDQSWRSLAFFSTAVGRLEVVAK